MADNPKNENEANPETNDDGKSMGKKNDSDQENENVPEIIDNKRRFISKLWFTLLIFEGIIFIVIITCQHQHWFIEYKPTITFLTPFIAPLLTGLLAFLCKDINIMWPGFINKLLARKFTGDVIASIVIVVTVFLVLQVRPIRIESFEFVTIQPMDIKKKIHIENDRAYITFKDTLFITHVSVNDTGDYKVNPVPGIEGKGNIKFDTNTIIRPSHVKINNSGPPYLISINNDNNIGSIHVDEPESLRVDAYGIRGDIQSVSGNTVFASITTPILTTSGNVTIHSKNYPVTLEIDNIIENVAQVTLPDDFCSNLNPPPPTPGKVVIIRDFFLQNIDENDRDCKEKIERLLNHVVNGPIKNSNQIRLYGFDLTYKEYKDNISTLESVFKTIKSDSIEFSWSRIDEYNEVPYAYKIDLSSISNIYLVFTFGYDANGINFKLR